jgi:hypothetical protein
MRRYFKWFRLPSGTLGPAVEVTGAVLIITGICVWSPPLALVVAGGFCIFLAQGIEAKE